VQNVAKSDKLPLRGDEEMKKEVWLEEFLERLNDTEDHPRRVEGTA